MKVYVKIEIRGWIIIEVFVVQGGACAGLLDRRRRDEKEELIANGCNLNDDGRPAQSTAERRLFMLFGILAC